MDRNRNIEEKEINKKNVLFQYRKRGFPIIYTSVAMYTRSRGGGAAGIAKAVNDAKINRFLLEEQKRQNVIMESSKGKGLYLRPCKGYGLSSKN